MPINITGTLMNVLGTVSAINTAANTKKANEQAAQYKADQDKQHKDLMESIDMHTNQIEGYTENTAESVNMIDQTTDALNQNTITMADDVAKMKESLESYSQIMNTKKMQNLMRKELKKQAQGGKR